MNRIVAKNVKRILEEKCLKQCAIAKKAGYTNQQFNDMLNGRKLMKDIDIVRIMDALEVDANTLFDKEG